ncbi:MAG: NUDIX domain-containing protein [Phycisphaerales bacterium]|nr:NUDIX domain-containing protein [Phycisphaerales bacterium]
MPHAHIELIARGVLVHHSKVLVCRNLKHGYCYLPGGHVEFAERAADALSRELREEAGLESRVGAFLIGTEEVFESGRRLHHEVNLVFHVEQLGDESSPPTTVSSKEPGISFGWIDLAALHEADLRPASIKAWLLAGGNDVTRWISGLASSM